MVCIQTIKQNNLNGFIYKNQHLKVLQHGGIKLAYNVWANAHIEVKFYTTITFRCFKAPKGDGFVSKLLSCQNHYMQVLCFHTCMVLKGSTLQNHTVTPKGVAAWF